MRVAVYAIARNEAHNVAGWAECATDADQVLLCDTGSTDNTMRLADKAGIRVEQIRVDPWRFDDARNAALALVPGWVDYCIVLDLDERLQPGWREALEKAVAAGITRPLSRLTYSWHPDGSPGGMFLSERAHRRFGFRWKHPVHEVLVPWGTAEEARAEAPGLDVHHHSDDHKDRTGYLPLLELAVAEDPTDDRTTFYLAREYLFRDRWDRAEDTFRTHLALPRARWQPERAASMRYLGDVIWLRRWNLPGGAQEAEGWYLRAAAEAPEYREGWWALAQHYIRTDRPALARVIAQRGLEVTERRLDYITTPEPWSGAMEALAGF